MSGFSLVELLTVIVIVCVLVLGAVLVVDGVGNSMKLSALTNNLLSHLRLARSESIKRNGRVALCKSSDGQTCALSGGWEQGWIIFHDANNDGQRASTEVLLQRGDPAETGYRVTGNTPVARYISFHPSGETRLTGGGFQAGTITVCRADAGTTEARQIVLNSVGRPRTVKVSVASCA